MTEVKGSNRFDYEVVKLLRLMKVDDVLLQTVDAMLRAMLPIWEEEDPDFPAERFIQKFQQKIDTESLLYAMVPFYSQHYTREETAGLITFYETPLGRKMQGKGAQILQECIAANQAWAEAMVEKIAEDMDSLS
jgi:hypothetical protein